MTSNKKLIVIVGPTAVGKTETAIQLAEKLNGEIISADSRLFYRGMDIGTAKPTPAERARVPHHLIDVVEPNETYSLARFQQEASAVIQTIHAKNKLPLLVGGTGQYIRAVTQGWTPPAVQADEGLRSVLENMKTQMGASWIHDRLASLDPEAASSIDARNARRTIRALEVIFTTGEKFSSQRTQTESPYALTMIGLTRPRAELYARVDARIEKMFADGFVDEVRGLLARGVDPNAPALSAIGYRECIEIINGTMTVEEAVIQIKKLTRIFVRRQANWFKPSDASIKWFEMNAKTVDEIVKLLSN